MKILFVGGTGNISTSVSKRAIEQGHELYLLNRGQSNRQVEGAKSIQGDIHQPETVKEKLKEHQWDVVVNWIAFTPDDVKRDVELFAGNTKQYIFISSASIYQKPPTDYIITESTPIYNPFWKYSRDKIDCELYLMQQYRESAFPVTIVRPSHTYETILPLSVFGGNDFTVIDRIMNDKKVVIHGDGTSLWTLTHSKDFAKGFCGLLGNAQALGHAIHITSDEVLNWNQIYEHIAEALGKKLHAVYVSSEKIEEVAPSLKGDLTGDKAHCAVFDNSKIKRLVPEFSATIPFREGIQSTLNWFQSDPERMKVNTETNKALDQLIAFAES